MACFRALRSLPVWHACILGVSACFMCFTCLLALCTWLAYGLGVLQNMACLACFIKWRAWRASKSSLLGVLHKMAYLKSLNCFVGVFNYL